MVEGLGSRGIGFRVQGLWGSVLRLGARGLGEVRAQGLRHWAFGARV